MKLRKKQRGVTLIELLLVIAIIAIITAAILVAINPAKRLAQSRNAKRWQETSAVLNAVLKYMVDNSGSYPSGIDSTTGTVQVLGTGGAGACATCSGESVVTSGNCLDLSSDLVDQYLSAIPSDPQTGTAADTQYFINKTSNGRIKVGACNDELGVNIYVQR